MSEPDFTPADTSKWDDSHRKPGWLDKDIKKKIPAANLKKCHKGHLNTLTAKQCWKYGEIFYE